MTVAAPCIVSEPIAEVPTCLPALGNRATQNKIIVPPRLPFLGRVVHVPSNIGRPAYRK